MLVSLCAETIKKKRYEGEQHLTAVKGNASVYQVCPVSRISGEGRAQISRAWGTGVDEQKGAGGGREQQSARENCKSYTGANLTVVERMHQYIMYIL